VPALREALATVELAEPGNEALRDSLRVDLIVALGQIGEHAQARDEAEALIAEAGARPGDPALLVALVQIAVARSHSYLGDDARAEALLLAAQPVVIERLGEAHTRHFGLLNELMAVYFRRNDWERALPYAEQVYQRIRARLGDEHNMSQVSRGNWGRLLYEMGRDKDAAAQIEPAHDALVRALGERAPQAQDLGVLRAALAIERADPAAARGLLDTLDAEVLEGARGSGLWQHQLDALRGLLLARTGQSEAARALLASSVAGLQDDPRSGSSRLFRDARAALERLGPGES
jgi:eukaryotic-like serine/threonine-protein kinase